MFSGVSEIHKHFTSVNSRSKNGEDVKEKMHKVVEPRGSSGEVESALAVILAVGNSSVVFQPFGRGVRAAPGKAVKRREEMRSIKAQRLPAKLLKTQGPEGSRRTSTGTK